MSKIVYLASPLGFSYHGDFRDRLTYRLEALGHIVVDPWKFNFDNDIKSLMSIKDVAARQDCGKYLATRMGTTNCFAINGCDIVLGVCDGTQVDDGTASEMGYAAGKDKAVYGIRTDFRNCGEFLGVPINLQVLYWITLTGGRLFTSVEEIDF